MEIRGKLTKKDLRAFYSFAIKRMIRNLWETNALIKGFLLCAISSVILAIAERVVGLDVNSFFLGLLAAYPFTSLCSYLLSSHLFPRKDEMLFKDRVLSISSEGIRVRTDTSDSIYFWKYFESIELSKKHFFIMIDNSSGFIIPHRVFPNEFEMQAFIQKTKEYLELSSKSVD